jgi:hypothetical protein
MSPPRSLIADTLNNRTRDYHRGHIDDDTVPRLHVSSLIKSGTADFFCPREFVLRHMERRGTSGNALPPKFALLFAVGNFYGGYIVQQFIERNPEYGQFAWGDWRCICGHTKAYQTTRAAIDGMVCNQCAHPVEIYVETDLFSPDKTVVGHADLILFVDGIFYIYEFKTIDRADIVFKNINAPLGDHLLQASNYFYMLREQMKGKHRVSKNIRFVYVDRSMAGIFTENPFREVEAVAVQADRLERIYNTAKLCHTSIKKGILPERLCNAIDCSRAKQCTVAVSCFNRKLPTIQRIALASTQASPALASTVPPSTTKNGMASSSKPVRKALRIPSVSSPSAMRSKKP